MLKNIAIALYIIVYSSILNAQPIANGNWKGLIHYDTVEIPFIFNFENTSDSSAVVIIKNASEEITIKNVVIKNDSILIPMYVFDAAIMAKVVDGEMTGEWHKNYKNKKGPLFTATYNERRFSNIVPSSNVIIKNNWDITLTQPSGQTSKAVGLFAQNKNSITGTLMTELGDFRYFEGILYGDSVLISSFDGVHGFLMLGKFKNDAWSGVFHYENGYSEKWSATYDSEAKLANPFSLITVEPFTHQPYYDILTAGGEYNAINADLLDGKVVIIQLMGTWCPNSLDQTQYLTNWYNKQDTTKLKLLAVTYEPGNKNYAQQRIDNYSKLLNISYSMHIGGSLSKGQAALAFPNMGKINAFPSLIMIDKQGYIRYIDSYFNGPATSQYYQKFDKEFNAKVKTILDE